MSQSCLEEQMFCATLCRARQTRGHAPIVTSQPTRVLAGWIRQPKRSRHEEKMCSESESRKNRASHAFRNIFSACLLGTEPRLQSKSEVRCSDATDAQRGCSPQSRESHSHLLRRRGGLQTPGIRRGDAVPGGVRGCSGKPQETKTD
jgi:hypothetical protein